MDAKPRWLGCRSEVILKTFFFLSLSLLFIFAAPTFAQSATGEVGGVAMRADADSIYSGTTRPRIETVANVSAPGSVRALERRAFDLINEERTRRGLRALEWSDDAAQVARSHSRNMAQYHFFSHKGLDGSMANDRAEQMGIFNWRAIGENIAFNRGYNEPADFAVQTWLESPAHKANMLNKDWNESGIGAAVAADGSYYFTQVFLLRK